MVLMEVIKLPKDVGVLNQKYEDVEIYTDFNASWQAPTYCKIIPLFAKIKLNHIPINEAGFWDIPQEPRKKCEAVIEYLSAVFAVHNGLKQQLYSAFGATLMFEPENEDEVQALKNCKGYEKNTTDILFRGTSASKDFDWANSLSDRKLGVFLMNEAISHVNSSGKFRDYIRLFENSFSLSSKQLSKKLLKLLNPKFGYTRAEIDDWVRFRDPLSHADNKKNNVIYFESDITPYIHRMEQAARDVLLNKLSWGTPTSERRELWHPTIYTIDGTGTCPLRPGGEFIVNLVDRFGVYKIHLDENFKPLSPKFFTDCKIAETFSRIKLNIGGLPAIEI
jgi:hypothetical protein